jgi:hypothetical protein
LHNAHFAEVVLGGNLRESKFAHEVAYDQSPLHVRDMGVSLDAKKFRRERLVTVVAHKADLFDSKNVLQVIVLGAVNGNVEIIMNVNVARVACRTLTMVGPLFDFV